MDPAPSAPAAAGADPSPWSGWRLWLLLGACFGLGYGVCQRLLALDLPLSWSSPERFSVKSFPGTELNSLRSRLGDTSLPIRGDLDLHEQERQQQREAAAFKQRRSQMEAPLGEPPDQAPLGDPAPLPSVPADPAAPAAPEAPEAPEASASPEPAAPPPSSPPAVPPANATP